MVRVDPYVRRIYSKLTELRDLVITDIKSILTSINGTVDNVGGLVSDTKDSIDNIKGSVDSVKDSVDNLYSDVHSLPDKIDDLLSTLNNIFNATHNLDPYYIIKNVNKFLAFDSIPNLASGDIIVYEIVIPDNPDTDYYLEHVYGTFEAETLFELYEGGSIDSETDISSQIISLNRKNPFTPHFSFYRSDINPTFSGGDMLERYRIPGNANITYLELNMPEKILLANNTRYYLYIENVSSGTNKNSTINFQITER